MIYLIEHVRCDVVFEITWHYVKKTREGVFVCRSVRGLVGTSGVELESREHGSRMHEFEARDLLAQRVVCIEQEGFEFFDEHVREQVDIKSMASSMFSKRELNMSSLASFQSHQEGLVDVMPLPAGVAVKVIVDEYGDAFFLYTASKTDEWFRPCASMQLSLERSLMHIDAKGFVAEGIFTGTRLFVTDIHYVLNRGVHAESFRAQNEYAHKLDALLDLRLRLLKVYTCNVGALSTLFSDTVLGLQVESNCGSRYLIARGEVGELSFGMVTKDKKCRGADDQCRDLGWFDVWHLPKFDFLSFKLLGYRQSAGGKCFLGV